MSSKNLDTKKADKSSLSMLGFVVPAIDIIEGKCVRLTQGDYEKKKVYNEKPLEVALQFQDAGLKRLHLVDLDGARAGKVRNWKVLENLASKTSLKIDFGGGVKTEKDVGIIFDSGGSWATVGSIAVKDEKELLKWFERFGTDKFMLGADVKDKMIAISGWTESTEIEVEDFIGRYHTNGVNQIFCTDVSKDGKLEGPAIDLYDSIIKKFPGVFFIASGGVSSMKDLEQLRNIGCGAAIVGKAIYENRITLRELKTFNYGN